MDPARIAELLAPFLSPADDRRPATEGVKQGLAQSISTYINILLRWNARINLTAIRDPEEIVTRHFGESLFAARLLFPCDARVGPGVSPGHAERNSAEDANDQRPATNDRVADLGSGAGFPGLPIKLWVPDISLTLIESSHKKAAFLREVIRALTLTDVNVLTARAETLAGTSFDLVTLRAVERFSAALSIAANLVAPGGRLAILIGTAQFAQAHSLLPHFSWQEPQPIPMSRSRILAVAHRPD